MSDHYKSHPSGIEAIELTQYESFLRGNILKYVLRAPYKGDELADLEKAAEYLQWEIERVKEEEFWAQYDQKVVGQRLTNLFNKVSHLEEVDKMRDEWDEDYYDYYRAGMVTRPFEKSFDEVAFPDKCQECDGDCKVC